MKRTKRLANREAEDEGICQKRRFQFLLVSSQDKSDAIKLHTKTRGKEDQVEGAERRGMNTESGFFTCWYNDKIDDIGSGCVSFLCSENKRTRGEAGNDDRSRSYSE